MTFEEFKKTKRPATYREVRKISGDPYIAAWMYRECLLIIQTSLGYEWQWVFPAVNYEPTLEAAEAALFAEDAFWRAA